MKRYLQTCKLLTIFFLVVISFFSSAQELLLPGYVIMLSGDTTQGTIDYRNWDSNPKTVRFKPNLEETFVVYTPATIKGFGVADLHYIGATVSTDFSSTMMSNLEDDATLHLVRETAFIQAIIMGDKSLYHYKNSYNKDQFYIVVDDSLQLLEYKKYMKETNGYSSVMENNKFVGQLIIYLQGCPSMQQDLQSAKYRKKSLVNLFNKYYQCVDESVDYKVKHQKANVDFGVFAGVTLTKLTVNSSSKAYLDQTDYPISTRFTAGFFVDMDLSKTKKRWSINSELLFSSYETHGTNTEFIHSEHYFVRSTTFEYSYFKINSMFRYRYPVKNLHLFGSLGMSFGIMNHGYNSMTTESVIGTYHDYKTEPAIDNVRKFTGGMLVGLGVKYQRFLAEVRFETGSDIAGFANVSAITHQFDFLLGFRF